MRELACSVVFFLAVMLAACGSDGTSGTSGSPLAGQRPVTASAGTSYGATCASDAECGGVADSCCTGGKCSAQGWCSPTCKDDRACPAGFFCIDHSGSRCFYGCTDDRDCPTGFICEEKSGHKTCRFK